MGKKLILGLYFNIFGLIVLALGVTAIYFGATYEPATCGWQLRKFFLGIGIIYCLGGLSELVVGFSYLRCLGPCRALRKISLVMIHCVGIPALVFAILGSLWTFRASPLCQATANPWRRAEWLLFGVYAAVGLGFLGNLLLLPLVGNVTPRMFN